MRTIILTGGGTAGHCLPHFAVLKYLYASFDKIVYIGSKTGIEKKLVTEKGLPYYEISPCKLIRSFSLKNLTIPVKFIKSVKDAKEILLKEKPTVIFSKGGFVGLPVAVAGKQLNIPVIIHESDLTMGLANKISSKFASKVLTSFPSTYKNGIAVGSPIREELFKVTKSQALNTLNIKTDKPVLLITGGSSGAKKINELVLKNLNELTKKFTVIHLVGKNNLSRTQKKDYYEYEFLNSETAFNACDICVSRAGSNTAFELIALKKPTLFIPLPKGNSRGDQIDNAKYFLSKNLCKVLYQENAEENFLKEVLTLYEERESLKSQLNKQNIIPANKKIAEILTAY